MLALLSGCLHLGHQRYGDRQWYTHSECRWGFAGHQVTLYTTRKRNTATGRTSLQKNLRCFQGKQKLSSRFEISMILNIGLFHAIEKVWRWPEKFNCPDLEAGLFLMLLVNNLNEKDCNTILVYGLSGNTPECGFGPWQYSKKLPLLLWSNHLIWMRFVDWAKT